MSYRSPRNVVVLIKPPERFALRCRTLPIVREDRSVDRLHESLSERVFTCLYRAGRGGRVRGSEGIEAPLPGNLSERTWSKD
jgi:hypothetical protein